MLGTGDQKGWPTYALHGRPSLVSQVGEMHVIGETILTQFATEYDIDDGHVELLPKLEKLSLIGLPKLRHIYNWDSSTNNFPSDPIGISYSLN